MESSSNSKIEFPGNFGNLIDERIDFKEKTKALKFKKKNIFITLGLIILVLGLALSPSLINMEGYKVYLGDTYIGSVREELDFRQVYNNVTEEIRKEYGMGINVDGDLSFKKSLIGDKKINSPVQLESQLKKSMNFKLLGYALYINGERLGALRKKSEINSVLGGFTDKFLQLEEGQELLEERIVENIDIVMEEVGYRDLIDKDELSLMIESGQEEIKTHTIEKGENYWTIASLYGMEPEELELANPEKNPQALQIGDEIKLIRPKAMINVETKVQLDYLDKIDYETEIIEDPSMYTDEKKVKVVGVNGLAKIKAKEIRENGFLVDKEIISQEIIEEPVKEVVIQGTKEIPKTRASGTFAMPCRGRFTSGYGMRWGRMHTGIDIANRVGTRINAADGGEVVYVGRKGAYGLMVEIDHKNGFKTRYAHCSKFAVKTGDKVYKGQKIAEMGNTGRSTGPHLHFEILKNGSHRNPMNYLK